MKRFAVVLAFLAMVAGACGDKMDDDAGPNPTAALKFMGPPTGTVVRGNVVTVKVAATGIRIVKADGDTSGRTGHYHVFIDTPPVEPGDLIPKTANVVHSAVAPIVLTGLSEGPHQLWVVLGDGTHHRLGRSIVHTSVHVKGPTIKVTGPATATVGQPITITVAAHGIRLVPADGDTSGVSGHLHVFIDRAPTPAGQPIPKAPDIIHTAATKIDIPAFTTPGEHTLWVVVGDGVHTPFKPPVMDKLTVVVS
jgi:ribosomal protein L28